MPVITLDRNTQRRMVGAVWRVAPLAGIHWLHIQGTVQDSALHWSQTPPWLFQDYDAKPLLISQLITLGKPKMCNLPLGPISQESVYGKKDILHLPVKITVNKQIYGVSIILLL